MTVVSDYTALLSGNSWTGGPANQAVVLTYAFSAAPTDFVRNNYPAAAASFAPLSEAQRAAVRAALAQWSATSGITFHEVSATPGDLAFGLYRLAAMGSGEAAGEGTYPSNGLYLDGGKPHAYSNFLPEGGDVYLDASYFGADANANDFTHVALHEIGHALGLKHPFDGSTTLSPDLDNGGQTVMSYSGVRAATLGPLDVAAIQHLYGTPSGAISPFPTRWNAATESVTEFGTAAAQLMFGSGGDDVFLSGGGRDAISGGEGDDVVYANGSPIEVNGGPGTDTVVTGLTYSSAVTISGSGTFRYIYLPAAADFQTFSNVEKLDFTNGVYDLLTNTFAAVTTGTYAWTGNVDAAWATPGNWKAVSGGSAAQAPGASDTVTLGTTGTVTGGGRAASLFLSGAPALAGSYVAATLAAGTARTTLANYGSLAASRSATLAGGQITVSGTATVLEVGGTGFGAGGSGTFQLDAGGTFGGYGLVNSNAFNNYGTLVASGGTLRIVGEAAVANPGTARIEANSTLWLQNLHGTYAFAGDNATLRTDTSGGITGYVSTVSGFAPGDALVLSGAFASVDYAATGTGTGRLSTATTAINLLGDFGAYVFNAVANAAENTTVVTLAPKPVVADPLFDRTWYLARYADVRAAGIDPYAHYLNYGWRENRDPSALFSTSYYLARNADVVAVGMNPLLHYTAYGAAEGRNPDRLFDDRFYLTQNADVRAAGINPLLHFATYGWRENRDPSLLFSDGRYLAANADVSQAGLNPLAHYLGWGAGEGRQAALSGGTLPADPLVSAAFYDLQLGATLLPGGTAAAQQAAWSYDAVGWSRGLNPDPWFDTGYYLSHNPDVAAAHINPLTHYENYGWRENRDPSAGFSSAKYLAAYADVRAANLNPLAHYVSYGQFEGRQAFAA